jgi:type II protein arginine methyltransferase
VTAGSDEIEAMIAAFAPALAGRADAALRLVDLAHVVARRRERVRAFELCEQALAAGGGDPEVRVRVRRLLSSLLPNYHAPAMNNARRNAAWRQALRGAVGPTTRALDIGTGPGTLALMAAQAGAAKVTACERDPLLALIAGRVVAANGLADRIDVVAKPLAELALGADMEGPADLVFLDVFGDDVLDDRPFALIADALRRLAGDGARVLPAGASLQVALADWDQAPRYGAREAAGFDVSAFADLTPPKIAVEIGAADLRLRSDPATLFRFDFTAIRDHVEGETELALTARADGPVNGVLHWPCLHLDAATALEERPTPGARSHRAPRFWPLPEPRTMRRGETLTVRARHTDREVMLWVV